MRNFLKNLFCSAFLFSLFSFFILNLPVTHSLTYEENRQKQDQLKANIDQKSKELQDIANKIKENQRNLEEVQGQSKSLQKEIKKIDSNVRQLDLSIQESKIVIDKLGLEIDSLGYSISDTEKKIETQKESIANTLQELQQKEGDNSLVIFLKNKSLADSVFETQSLVDISQGLTIQINNLQATKDELLNRLQEKANKKQLVEVENINLSNKKIILADTKQEKQGLLKETKNKEQLYQKSLTELEKRQADIAAEIEKAEEELRLRINPAALPVRRPGVLGFPIGGRISQDYGATNFARFGYRGKWHNGVDFSVPIGTPVFSAEKGRVAAVGNQDLYCYRGAYGKFIVIEHENNLTTLYAHLSLQIVHEGDIVERGSLIGYSGRTGYATGPHLHFTVYASQTFYMGSSKVCGSMPYGGDLDPLNYLPS